jgi:hypothetical protein
MPMISSSPFFPRTRGCGIVISSTALRGLSGLTPGPAFWVRLDWKIQDVADAQQLVARQANGLQVIGLLGVQLFRQQRACSCPARH